jgi:HPt (histidine-containing phosphotransfer) domain-containing protein
LFFATDLRQKWGRYAASSENVPLTGSVLGCGQIDPPNRVGWAIRTSIMSLHFERIEWMPSPPLAPGDGPIDFDHLRRMTLGDVAIEQEVLTMFSAQSAKLLRTLVAMPADASALAHTLKGSARAIGAKAVADAAARLETAIARGFDPSGALADLDEAVTEARAEIEAALRHS